MLAMRETKNSSEYNLLGMLDILRVCLTLRQFLKNCSVNSIILYDIPTKKIIV